MKLLVILGCFPTAAFLSPFFQFVLFFGAYMPAREFPDKDTSSTFLASPPPHTFFLKREQAHLLQPPPQSIFYSLLLKTRALETSVVPKMMPATATLGNGSRSKTTSVLPHELHSSFKIAFSRKIRERLFWGVIFLMWYHSTESFEWG